MKKREENKQWQMIPIDLFMRIGMFGDALNMLTLDFPQPSLNFFYRICASLCCQP